MTTGIAAPDIPWLLDPEMWRRFALPSVMLRALLKLRRFASVNAADQDRVLLLREYVRRFAFLKDVAIQHVAQFEHPQLDQTLPRIKPLRFGFSSRRRHTRLIDLQSEVLIPLTDTLNLQISSLAQS